MRSTITSKALNWIFWAVLVAVSLLQYFDLFRRLIDIWFSDTNMSYGALIPAIIAFLIWKRRHEFSLDSAKPWWPAILIVLAGQGLNIVAGLSGNIVFYGIALSLSLIGAAGLLWGQRLLKVVALPLGLLILMVPLPSYVIGLIGWYLQIIASDLSAALLQTLGVQVYQEGNLLRLPNYILEVREACSGLRSIFALLTLSVVIGFQMEKKWWMRLSLVLATPILAICANVIRITGTGVIASRYRELAANDSLHELWGIMVFLSTIFGLLCLRRFLRWAVNAYA